ncbi:MAG: Ppx/GppA phosphatase family protein [Actinomycetota bacterium]|nr:Ppx/GppA phosphatase family protein [Actinomycetota bacterium]
MPGGNARRVAAIDCGTNSLRLLVADVDPEAGRLTDLHRSMEIVRLGQGVDATGRLAPEALDRTFAVLRRYAETIGELGAEKVRMVATSATRDASNAAEFTAGVSAILRIAPEVVTGSEEARLSFAGATAELGPAAGARLEPPFLVVDIGGGSTEFVLGAPDVAAGAGLAAMSMNVGSVRLTERHLHDDPPTEAQIRAAAADIGVALDAVAAAMPVSGARTLVGLAGSVTTVAGVALGLTAYDSRRIHHARLSAARIHEVTENLLRIGRAQRAAITVIHPGRVDVIGAGALILDQIMRRFGFAEVVVSEHDILDGIAWSMVPGPATAPHEA